MRSFGDAKVGSFWKLKEEFEGMLWNSAEGTIDEHGNPEYPPEEIDFDVYELVELSIEDSNNQRFIIAQFKGLQYNFRFGWDVDNIKDYLICLGNNKSNVETLYKL